MPLKAQSKPIKFRLTINQTDYKTLDDLKKDFQVDSDSNTIDAQLLSKWMKKCGNDDLSKKFESIPQINVKNEIDSIIDIVFQKELACVQSLNPLAKADAIYKHFKISGIRIFALFLKRDPGLLEQFLDKDRIDRKDFNELYRLTRIERLHQFCIPNSTGITDSLDPFAERVRLENRPLPDSLQIDSNQSQLYRKTVSKLKELIDINAPIICIQNHDFVRVDKLIADALDGDIDNIDEWNPGTFVTRFSNKEPFIPESFNFNDNTYSGGESLESFLSRLLKSKEEKVVVLKDVHRIFDDNHQLGYDNQRIFSLLHTIGQRRLYDGKNKYGKNGFYVTIIIVTSVSFNIPKELFPYISFLDLPRPDEDEIKYLIDCHLRVNDALLKGDEKKIISSLRGLSAFEIDRALDMAIGHNLDLTDKDTVLLQDQKKEMIKKSGLLELCENKGDIHEIGGLDYLKEYLKRKGKLMAQHQDAIEFGLSMPKGIMLVGMPGCGKSMCAKAAAMLFNDIPLLKMDIGNLQGKYVGESESNMRQAIKIAEAAAPCILWIDEIEKAFAGISSSNEAYTTRMFGSFLTWMQDKTSQVYIIATANNISNLPPEFKRKGRFDEIFCMDLPNEKERKQIFDALLTSRHRKCLKLDSYPNKQVKELLDATIDCNGADINSIIDNSLEEIFLESPDLKNKNDKNKVITKLIDVAKRTPGINKYCKDQLQEMRDQFKKNHFINANNGKVFEKQDK